MLSNSREKLRNLGVRNAYLGQQWATSATPLKPNDLDVANRQHKKQQKQHYRYRIATVF
jgi:hypothetical protein